MRLSVSLGGGSDWMVFRLDVRTDLKKGSETIHSLQVADHATAFGLRLMAAEPFVTVDEGDLVPLKRESLGETADGLKTSGLKPRAVDALPRCAGSHHVAARGVDASAEEESQAPRLTNGRLSHRQGQAAARLSSSVTLESRRSISGSRRRRAAPCRGSDRDPARSAIPEAWLPATR